MRKLAQVLLINVIICGISSEHWQLQVTLKNVIVIMVVILTWGLPCWLSSKESAWNTGVAGDSGLIPGWGRRAWQATPVFSPGESHGQRSQAGYSPWGSKRASFYQWAKLSLKPSAESPSPTMATMTGCQLQFTFGVRSEEKFGHPRNSKGKS